LVFIQQSLRIALFPGLYSSYNLSVSLHFSEKNNRRMFIATLDIEYI